LLGAKHKDIEKFKIAAHLFQLDRNIALGPAYYYLMERQATEESLYYMNIGIAYDPNAVDLINGMMIYNFILGKNNDALIAFNKLAKLAPNSSIVKQLSKKEN
jgi:hypothetical protein